MTADIAPHMQPVTGQAATSNGEPSAMAPRRLEKAPEKVRKGRNRPRASLACLSCRERKTKCTRSEEPNRCASCRSLGIPCVIAHLADRRRVQSREQFRLLQDRVHHLEDMLVEQARRYADIAPGLSVPSPCQDRQGSPCSEISVSTHALNDGPANETQEETTSATFLESHYVASQQNEQRDAQQIGSIDWSAGLNIIDTNQSEPASSVNDPGRRRSTLPSTAQETSSHQIQSPDDDAPRLDFDQENGQSRFYGPTSQLHTRDHSLPKELRQESIRAPGNEIQIDSKMVKESLLRSYWESQPLSQAIVERKRFEAGRRLGVRSEYWSPFLECALLACASRMRTSPDIRALGPRYCKTATVEVTEELQSPNIATIQGFLLLSDYEATRGRERIGSLYCGIGCRMMIDLGLHESCTALVNQGRLTADDKLSRHLLFLGAYVYDTLWGLYLGRPSSIPVVMLQAAQSHMGDVKCSIPRSLEAWVGLATEIAEVTEIMNNNPVPLNSTAVSRLVEFDIRISRRAENLDPSLALQADRIPELADEAYGLHIQLCGIRIVLHKRLAQTIIANAGVSAGPKKPELAVSRKVMHENAVMIARLTSTYRRIFAIENVITVMLDNMFVAAALLISHVLNIERTGLSQPTGSDIAWLRCLSDMFESAQKHYPVTSRMLSTLSTLVEGTSMTGIFGTRTHSKPPDVCRPEQTQDVTNDLDWPMSSNFAVSQGAGQAEPFDFFLGGPDDLNYTAAPDMDPRNMMSWLLTPTEEVSL